MSDHRVRRLLITTALLAVFSFVLALAAKDLLDRGRRGFSRIHRRPEVQTLRPISEPGMLGLIVTETNPDGTEETRGVGLGYTTRDTYIGNHSTIDGSIDTFTQK